METSLILNREPVAVMAAVEAVLAVAIGFGLDVSTEQFGLIIAALTAVLALVARSKVSPVG